MGSLDTYSRNPEEFLISPSSQEDLGGGGPEAPGGPSQPLVTHASLRCPGVVT